MVRLDRLRVFASVAEKASFAEAARTLRVSQAAATLAIAALEDELGAALFRVSRDAHPPHRRRPERGAAHGHRARPLRRRALLNRIAVRIPSTSRFQKTVVRPSLAQRASCRGIGTVTTP